MNDSNDSDEASYKPSFETFRADPIQVVMPKTNNTQTLQLSMQNKGLSGNKNSSTMVVVNSSNTVNGNSIGSGNNALQQQQHQNQKYLQNQNQLQSQQQHAANLSGQKLIKLVRKNSKQSKNSSESKNSIMKNNNTGIAAGVSNSTMINPNNLSSNDELISIQNQQPFSHQISNQSNSSNGNDNIRSTQTASHQIDQSRFKQIFEIKQQQTPSNFRNNSSNSGSGGSVGIHHKLNLGNHQNLLNIMSSEYPPLRVSSANISSKNVSSSKKLFILKNNIQNNNSNSDSSAVVQNNNIIPIQQNRIQQQQKQVTKNLVFPLTQANWNKNPLIIESNQHSHFKQNEVIDHIQNQSREETKTQNKQAILNNRYRNQSDFNSQPSQIQNKPQPSVQPSNSQDQDVAPIIDQEEEEEKSAFMDHINSHQLQQQMLQNQEHLQNSNINNVSQRSLASGTYNTKQTINNGNSSFISSSNMIDNRNRNINQTMDGENLNIIHEGDIIRVECDYCKKQILLSELDKHENKCQTQNDENLATQLSQRRQGEPSYIETSNNQQNGITITNNHQQLNNSSNRHHQQWEQSTNSFDSNMEGLNRRLINLGGEIQNSSRVNIRYNTNNNQRYHNMEVDNHYQISHRSNNGRNYHKQNNVIDSNHETSNRDAGYQSQQSSNMNGLAHIINLANNQDTFRSIQIQSEIASVRQQNNTQTTNTANQNGNQSRISNRLEVIEDSNSVDQHQQQQQNQQSNPRQFDKSTRPNQPLKNPSAVPSTANLDDKRDSICGNDAASSLDIRRRYNIEVNDDLNENERREDVASFRNIFLADDDEDENKSYNLGIYEEFVYSDGEESKVDLVKQDSYEILSKMYTYQPEKTQNRNFQSVSQNRDSDHLSRYQNKISPDSEEANDEENDESSDHLNQISNQQNMTGYDQIINGIRLLDKGETNSKPISGYMAEWNRHRSQNQHQQQQSSSPNQLLDENEPFIDIGEENSQNNDSIDSIDENHGLGDYRPSRLQHGRFNIQYNNNMSSRNPLEVNNHNNTRAEDGMKYISGLDLYENAMRYSAGGFRGIRELQQEKQQSRHDSPNFEGMFGGQGGSLDNLEELDLALLKLRSDHLEEQHNESMNLRRLNRDELFEEEIDDEDEDVGDLYGGRGQLSEMRINLRNDEEEEDEENSFDIGTDLRDSSNSYNLRAEARDHRVRNNMQAIGAPDEMWIQEEEKFGGLDMRMGGMGGIFGDEVDMINFNRRNQMLRSGMMGANNRGPRLFQAIGREDNRRDQMFGGGRQEATDLSQEGGENRMAIMDRIRSLIRNRIQQPSIGAFNNRIRDSIDNSDNMSYDPRDDDNEENFDDYEALINLDEDVVQCVPQKLVAMLPVSKYTEGNMQNFSEENKSCTICMSSYELLEEFMILPCLHRFHSECIKEWFQRRNTCPNCKDRVCDHFQEELQSMRLPRASQQMYLMNSDPRQIFNNNSFDFDASVSENENMATLTQINNNAQNLLSQLRIVNELRFDRPQRQQQPALRRQNLYFRPQYPIEYVSNPNEEEHNINDTHNSNINNNNSSNNSQQNHLRLPLVNNNPLVQRLINIHDRQLRLLQSNNENLGSNDTESDEDSFRTDRTL